ncbi:MAG: LemA family protein [Candidatus Izemoplasmatales bacterium]|jgi:LemA protein|nr:LemA family protein [Candidatus Izemoplasmatales bacterium]MDD4595562.1 LemA family protein [Candidatus Izemoplasmatales bacterium]
MFLSLTGDIIGIIIAVVVVLLIIFIISVYNKLVVLRNKVRNGWSQIDVQLKRRFDMIPNLVETVKGYASHEKDIFTEFGKARGLYAQAQKTGDVGQMAEAEKGLSGTLSRLLMVQEQYPELKANENFKELMAQLKDTEDKISFNRQFYNDTVLNFNNKIEIFPSNIVARMFKFEAAKFFEVSEEAERQAVKVKF